MNGGRCGYLLTGPLDNGAVDHDLSCVDQGLGVEAGPGQPAPDQLAIKALSHGSA
jgi:hypothetical protein